MSSDIEKYSKKGLRTSYISTVVGISLVLFLIGLIFGGVLGNTDIQRQAKENLF
jgi:cell division transport system permease protein